MRVACLATLIGLSLSTACGPADVDAGSAASRTYTPEQRAAAQTVMTNARELCKIYEEGAHLVVECRSVIAVAQQLQFAVAIADADAVLKGRARNIYYYLPGGSQFAQVDPVNGVRLKE